MSRRYGSERTAREYDQVRSGRPRWKRENEAVEQLASGASGSVLDAGCGTGRFFGLWRRLGLSVFGMDASAAMLREARRKSRSARLAEGDVCALDHTDGAHDLVVCVRLLNLLLEDDMRTALRELCRVARSRVILTVALGAAYAPGKTTAVHDERKFRALVRRLGWRVVEEHPVLRWTVMALERRQ